MWPKRKPKNRRNDRESVLEVKMRSRDARRARWRMFAGLVAAVGGTALAVLAVWQAYRWTLHRVYTNQDYVVRRILLHHEGRLHPDRIRRWTGVRPGDNLLALDLERIRRDLEMNPWIARAEVETLRPDSLRLSVWEREPRAQIVRWRWRAAEREAWPETNYIDADGIVLPPLQPDWLPPGATVDFRHLTRLTGVADVEIVPGQRLALTGLDDALALIRAYEDSPMYGLVDLLEVAVGPGGTLAGRLRQGTELIFARDGFDRQMRRWKCIHEYAEGRGRNLAWLDLSVTNNLPARWQDTNAAPSPPRLEKPPRASRRHV